MSARIRTSEPAYRAPVSQWQSERARGTLLPMDSTRRVRAALTNPLVPNKAKHIGICVAVFATMILGVIL